MPRRWSAWTCVDALVLQMAAMGFDPAVVDERDRATVAFTHCPSASWPKATRTSSAACTAGCRGFVEAVGGGRWWRSGRWWTATRARSTSGVDALEATDEPVGAALG